MRCRDEYRALISKINIEKAKYAEEEQKVNDDLEASIQITTEKMKKWNNRIVIYIFAFMVFVGVIYEMLIFYNNKAMILIIIGIGLIILMAIFGVEIFYRVKLKKLNALKNEDDDEKIKLRDSINNLNNQIASLIVSVITLNEHFVELSNIKDETLLYQKWDEYTKQVIMSINKKYNYQATYSEYQEYYDEYEHYLLSKEKENEN